MKINIPLWKATFILGINGIISLWKLDFWVLNIMFGHARKHTHPRGSWRARPQVVDKGCLADMSDMQCNGWSKEAGCNQRLFTVLDKHWPT